MTDGLNIRALLSSLAPPPKGRQEKWLKVESYLPEIFAARDRGVPWSLIARTLSRDGIEVSATNLRIFVARKRKQNPQASQPKVTRLSRATVTRRAGRARTANTLTQEPTSTVVVEAQPTPVVDAPPLAKEQSKHAGIRRKNARL